MKFKNSVKKEYITQRECPTHFFILLVFLAVLSGKASAVTCISGCNASVEVGVSHNLGQGENQEGKTLDSSSVSTTPGVHRMSGGTAADWFVFGGRGVPPAGTKYDDWQYQRVDDYISMALRYQDNCRTVYAPFNIEALNQKTCRVRRFLPWERITVVPRTYASRIRIDKRMIGGTYSKRILLGEFGKSQPFGSVNKDVIVTRIYLNLDITVPENCVLNSGQVFAIDFGNMPSSSFKRAHEKAEGVNPIVRTIGIQCTNIQSQANLVMRVQSDSVSGNVIISDNKDVGFIITDSNNKELTPNLFSSMIPFVLGNNSSANVTIKLYPASVTGRQPKEGAVTSFAYLRVDFS